MSAVVMAMLQQEPDLSLTRKKTNSFLTPSLLMKVMHHSITQAVSHTLPLQSQLIPLDLHLMVYGLPLRKVV